MALCSHSQQTEEEGATQCHGQRVPPSSKCLEHLDDGGLEVYLSGLYPGADIEHRGTRVSGGNLRKILTSITDPTSGRPTFGTARFDSAKFSADVNFGSSDFKGLAVFQAAHFEGLANFARVEFNRNADFRQSNFKRKTSFVKCSFGRAARFEDVDFAGSVVMNEAKFKGSARFERAVFDGRSHFIGAQFSQQVGFRDAVFNGDTHFSSVTFARDAQFGQVVFEKSAWFGKCQFEGLAAFVAAQFKGGVRGERCIFSGPAQFDNSKFGANAEFEGAKFKVAARFGGARFSGQAQFKKASFEGSVSFRFASFVGAATFSGTLFAGTAGFDSATFDSGAKFDQASFSLATHLGPMVCLGTLHWSGAEFSKPITIEMAAPRVRFRRTRFDSAATIKVRYAAVDLTDATMSSPVTVIAHPTPFVTTGASGLERVSEARLIDQNVNEVASVISVRGVDVSHLVLTDVYLTDCEFSGAVQLDKIHLQGDYRFPAASTKWGRFLGIPLLRPTRRVTLAEEQYWRASRSSSTGSGWKTGSTSHNPDPDTFTPKPRNLAATYRELRKSLEDSKNEPDAADFYYGEMEMRRHDETRPAAERVLLALYWLISGYGLRATRAFTALLIALCLASSAVMLLGLPSSSQPVRPSTSATEAVLDRKEKTPTLSLGVEIKQRASWRRFEEANRANLNAIFFRRSEVNLTTVGVYIQMVARLIVPTFFVLGVLAIRNRVKR